MIVILAIAAMLFNSLLRGWVLAIQWEWFLVPLGVPSVGIVHAIGVSLVVSMLTHQMDTNEHQRDAKERAWEAIIYSTLMSLLFLLSGWITLQFMGAN